MMSEQHPHSQVSFTALLTLLEITRSVRPTVPRSLAAPRSFAQWTRQERQLVAALQQANIDDGQTAALLQRTPEALRLFMERRGVRLSTFEPAILRGLPRSSLSIEADDVDLLASWPQPAVPDPFGWRFGQALPVGWIEAMEVPTLRVILARPGPDPAAAAVTDWQDAAQATWMDLAANLVQEDAGGILHHGPDRHHSRQLALRGAVQRVRGQPARRGSVREWTPGITVPGWNRLLIADPERWNPASIAALSSIQTVVLVLPDHDDALNRLGGMSSPPWAPPVTDWAAEQQAMLTRWSAGRQLITEKSAGWPNSHGRVARLDWMALGVVPPEGELICAREDLMLRASTWMALTQGVRVRLPTEVRERYISLLEPLSRSGVHRTEARGRLQQHLDQLSPPLSPTDRVVVRALLDAFYPPGAEFNTGSLRDTALTLTVGDHRRLTYIGR